MTELDQYRTALVALAARSCENFTTGPGSCVKYGRKMVTEGPEFTGTADEMCYPCVAWAALNYADPEPTDLDALRDEVEQEPEFSGWGSIDRSIYRRDLLNLIDLLRFNEERLRRAESNVRGLREKADLLRGAYDRVYVYARGVEKEYGRNATRLQLIGEVGALQETLQGHTATIAQYEKALNEILKEANFALGEEEADAPYTPRGALIVARHVASKALHP